jgi:hypothetical protein
MDDSLSSILLVPVVCRELEREEVLEVLLVVVVVVVVFAVSLR